MKASAVADAPPVISSMTPRSQVTKATAMTTIQYGNGRLSSGQLTEHGRAKNDSGEEDMSLHVECFVREEVLLYYLYTGLSVSVECLREQYHGNDLATHK